MAMQVIKYNYTIKGSEKQFEATVLTENKDKGIALIIRKLKGAAIRVDSMSLVGDVHAIDDEVIDKISNSDVKIKKYQEKIALQNRTIEGLQHELTETQKLLDENNRKPQVSSADLKAAMKDKVQKVYVCNLCNYEGPSRHALRIHMSKAHADQNKSETSERVTSPVAGDAGVEDEKE